MPIDGPDLLQPEALRWAWVILPAVLVLACTGLFLGACIQRWGRRALWLLWAAYMAVFLFGDTFTRLAEGAGRDTLLGRALGAVVDVLAFIPGVRRGCFWRLRFLQPPRFQAPLCCCGAACARQHKHSAAALWRSVKSAPHAAAGKRGGHL